MYWFFLKEKLFFVIFFLTLFISNVLSNEVRIEFKVDNEIVTNIDINKEYRYLITLNNNLQTLEKNKIYEIARLSVIKEIVKKNELKKYYDLNQNPDYMKEIIKNFYKGLNINNEEEFKEYLLTHELKMSDVKKKLEIEAIWNEFIFTKYKDQVKIDEDKLRKILKEQIDSGNQIQKNYLLSEIFFNEKNTENLTNKYNQIKESIIEIGFENTANKYSQSDSARNGGNIGWVKESQLSEVIKKQIINLKIGENSEIITLPGGFLIIKVNEIKKEKVEKNFEKELKKFILYEKNRQLNQFSIIYFNRIKQNAEYSEK
jgi:peptidyl-prolyl cis-trans isomerase SurA